MAAANQELIRAINRFGILNAIRRCGPISRVEISRATGLSQASVTGITAELIAEGLLQEGGTGASAGGRRPVLLSLKPDGAYAVGVYLSIHQISVVVVDFEASVVASRSTPLEKRYHSPEALADKTAQAIQGCMWEANFAKEQIAGIGIGVPGMVDSETGCIRFLPNYQWERVNLRDLVQDRIDHPTTIENSANALTIAEQWFGEGKGLDNFLLITLEHGVGMGIVINGALYRGERGIAGELGHTTLHPDGPLCRCGRKGCLEASVGNYAILREARVVAAHGLWHPESPDAFTIDDVLEAAQNGNPALRRIYADAGRTLGEAMANLIVVFDPGRVFIAGTGAAAGNLLFDSMRQTVAERVSGKLDGGPELVVKPWSPTDYARGAGAMVLQEIYRHPAGRRAAPP